MRVVWVTAQRRDPLGFKITLGTHRDAGLDAAGLIRVTAVAFEFLNTAAGCQQRREMTAR